MPVTLVTGPVRSGKSRYAASIARRSGRRVTFIATALRDPDDLEWEARLARHAHDRPGGWETVESAALAHDALLDVFANASDAQYLVVDALGTWLAARLSASIDAFECDAAGCEARLDREGEELADAMLASRAHVVVIAEEVGWDVVPEMPSARMFRDVLGRIKQRIAARADHTYLVACGYALDLGSLGIAIE